MSPKPSFCSPPIALLSYCIEWSAQPELFWTHRCELGDSLRHYARALKEIIVWLELRRCEEQALRIDLATADLRSAWHEFDHACDCAAAIGPEDPRCRDALQVLLQQSNCLQGVLEDVAAEVPESVWKGFGDV